MTMLTVFEVKVTGGLGGPQSHGVDDVVSVAGDWGVVGEGQDHLVQNKITWLLFHYLYYTSFFNSQNSDNYITIIIYHHHSFH